MMKSATIHMRKVEEEDSPTRQRMGGGLPKCGAIAALPVGTPDAEDPTPSYDPYVLSPSVSYPLTWTTQQL